MTGQTQNLSLPQWQEDDYVLMGEFNEAFETIDEYVDTVNDQMDALESALSKRINLVNHNILQAHMLDQILGSCSGMVLQGVYLALLTDPSQVSECTGFPAYVQWNAAQSRYVYDAGNGYYSDGDPHDVPTLGYNSHTASCPDDAFSGTVRRTITLAEPCSHLRCVLYAAGYANSETNLRQQARWAYPWLHTHSLAGVTAACRVNNVSAAAAGTLDDTWPETFTYQNTAYTTPIRQYVFDIDGSFSGSVVVEFPVTCPAAQIVNCLALAVLMA